MTLCIDPEFQMYTPEDSHGTWEYTAGKKKNIFQFTIFQVQAVTPQKINMEHNNEGLEDHFPF